MNTFTQNTKNGRTPDMDIGVVLLAHGSRRGSDTIDGLRLMVRRLQERLDERHAKVVMACLEFIQPDLTAAVSTLVADGRLRIVVMPFLLGRGTHTTEDLSEEIERALAGHPQAHIRASGGFGCDPALVDIVAERALLQTPSLNGTSAAGDAAAPSGVMLVKAGTRSPSEDYLWLHELGHRVEEQLGAGYAVAVAQSHFDSPTMHEAAAELVERRRVSSVTCVPYIFFPGLILTRNIMGGLKELGEKYPHIPFNATPTLGVDTRLVELTAQRILAALDERN